MKISAKGAIVLASMLLAVAACGDKESSDTSSSPAPTVAADSALAAKVPDAVKSDGKIVVGTDSTYAPNEFLDTDGKTVIGFDVDLFNAVAAKLGLRTEWVSSKFADVIPGVLSGKYEAGVSSFTINPERKAETNMVSYFNAGTQWAAKTGATIDPANACGKKVAVQASTVQVDDITAKSKACTDAGKPAITIEQFQGQDQASASVVSGKNDAMLADSPITAYAVKQTNGQLALVGDIYDSAPYGYVVKKDQTAYAEALRDAVAALIADGTYKQILTKWGVEAGAITTPALNP
ncbi:polar amino acid transport system substrate-binding protein [Allocatelliglobosispora scoriae]|uniref:Polar amino acid transport system substrate-binding protein n=1 Tax=Allocatelliglobosispora scoriae TaxID=643052 RepID=A0A841BQM2_9ACTN|nr:ABC transporter substrate-binding protein [Allocatelliglobosispora scoriae]MBB5869233.1 polar amino acid transport system substrate-binding protein [Allocatelliglobosispora scoriae]